MVLAVLLALLVLTVIGSAPVWPYSRGWGLYPSSSAGVLLLVVLVLLATGRLRP